MQLISCTNYGARNNKDLENFDDNYNNLLSKKNIESEYIQYLTFFSKELVNHFPNDVEHKISQTSNFKVSDLNYRPPSNYFFQIVSDFDTSDTTIDSLVKISKAKISASDTTNILIFTYTGLRKYDNSIMIMGKTGKRSTSVAKGNIKKRNKVPIPHFSSYPGKNTYSCLDSSYTIYVLDYEKGVFTDTSYLEENIYIPNEWKHGYTKGIALSKEEKSIVYWITVW
jgi:hypothetical protein